MTMPGSADVTVVAAPAQETHSYVDWPAIIAGIVLASAISIVLLTFGSAVGLGLADFDARDGASPILLAILAGVWLLAVQVSSFMAGGYITGRMRRRANDATEHEVDVRDGAHGLLVWAGALVVGAVLAMNGFGALANAVGSTAATVTNAAANVAGEAAEGADPNAYFTDMLFRPAPAGEAAAPAEGAAPDAAAAPAAPAAAPEPAAPQDDQALRAEAGRIFAANTVSGEFPQEDRDYLAQAVASRTGMSAEQAQARVDQVVGNVEAARAEAAELADRARKTGVIAAFLIAASFLASAVAAYWAASKGGRHRDKGTVFANAFRRF